MPGKGWQDSCCSTTLCVALLQSLSWHPNMLPAMGTRHAPGLVGRAHLLCCQVYAADGGLYMREQRCLHGSHPHNRASMIHQRYCSSTWMTCACAARNPPVPRPYDSVQRTLQSTADLHKVSPVGMCAGSNLPQRLTRLSPSRMKKSTQQQNSSRYSSTLTSSRPGPPKARSPMSG